MGLVIAQLTTFSEGLHEIRSSLDDGVKLLTSQTDEPNPTELETVSQITNAVSELINFNKNPVRHEIDHERWYPNEIEHARSDYGTDSSENRSYQQSS